MVARRYHPRCSEPRVFIREICILAEQLLNQLVTGVVQAIHSRTWGLLLFYKRSASFTFIIVLSWLPWLPCWSGENGEVWVRLRDTVSRCTKGREGKSLHPSRHDGRWLTDQQVALVRDWGGRNRALFLLIAFTPSNNNRRGRHWWKGQIEHEWVALRKLLRRLVLLHGARSITTRFL